MKRAQTIVLFALCLLLCFAPGVIGGRFQPGAWYANSVKPALTPPGWVFPVVWTGLYLLMAVALFLLWRRQGAGRPAAATGAFLGQLVLNALWTWLFFGLHQPGLALADLAGLWVLLIVSVVLFLRACPPAGALLLPYVAWASFAGWLNYQFWRLNGG